MASNIRLQRICEYCGNQFTARTTVTRYCSNECAKRGYKTIKRNEKIKASNSQTLQIISKPIEELKAREFLSIADTCMLLGISRRTFYRMLERGEIVAGKAGKRTIVRRSDIDSLFAAPLPVTLQESSGYKITDCYTLPEIREKYNISQSALFELIRRNNIPKVKRGIFMCVPKKIIDGFFN